MKSLLLIFVVLFMVSCGAAITVDYDEQVDFSKYQYYNFYPTIDSGLSGLDNARIIRLTDSLLHQRGFIKSDSPQIFINFYAHEFVSRSRNTIGIGVGSSGRNVGVGVSGGIPIGGRVVEQQLTVDFIDVDKDELVWQAVAEGEMKDNATPEQKEAYYLSVIQKILKKYPPQKK